ncbi:hypothetical protein GOP47_0005669, partial [Adiantum capillus-veneris]
ELYYEIASLLHTRPSLAHLYFGKQLSMRAREEIDTIWREPLANITAKLSKGMYNDGSPQKLSFLTSWSSGPPHVVAPALALLCSHPFSGPFICSKPSSKTDNPLVPRP